MSHISFRNWQLNLKVFKHRTNNIPHNYFLEFLSCLTSHFPKNWPPKGNPHSQSTTIYFTPKSNLKSCNFIIPGNHQEECSFKATLLAERINEQLRTKRTSQKKSRKKCLWIKSHRKPNERKKFNLCAIPQPRHQTFAAELKNKIEK